MLEKRLHHKLASYVFFVAALLATIAVAISFIMQFEHSKNKTEIMLKQLMDTVESTAAIAAYSNDKVIADDVISGLLRNDIVHKASISSDKGLFVEKSKNTQTDQQTQLTRALYSPFSEQQLIGQLIVTPEAQFNLMEAQYAAFSNAFNSLFLIAVTAIVILLVVRNNISNPLLLVSDTLHAIKAGEKKQIVVPEQHKRNELGRLVNDINDLLKNLEHEFKEEQVLRKAIQHMEKQLRHLFESSSAGLFLLDINGKLLTYNPTLLKVLHCFNVNIKNEKTISGSKLDFAAFFLNEKNEFQALIDSALQSGQLQSQDFSLQQETTTNPVWIHCLLSKVITSSGETCIEGVAFDVSERVNNELAVKHRAEHDALTGLLVKQAARTRFESYLAAANKPVISVFFLDLDGFKQANDTHGHDIGDQVLIKIAERLNACVRSSDLVSRIGGDEFLIIVFNNQSSQTEFSIAEKMINSIQQPIRINQDISVNVSASIGIANYALHGQNFDDLVKAADEAMYEVKRQGKNGHGIKSTATDTQVKLFTIPGSEHLTS